MTTRPASGGDFSDRIVAILWRGGQEPPAAAALPFADREPAPVLPPARRLSPANSDRPQKPRRSRGLAFSLLFLAAAGLGGAALPFTFGEIFPRSFSAHVRIEAGRDLPALAARLVSPESLDAAAAALALEREPEFSEARPGPFPLLADLLTGGETTLGQKQESTRRTLARSVAVVPDRTAGTLLLSVTTGSPVLSARIANALASQTVNAATAAALYDDAGLDAARRAMDEAGQALDDFRRQQGTDALAEAARIASAGAALDADIAAREEALAALKEESARAAALNLADLAVRSADLGADTQRLEDLRQNYLNARLDADRLAADLGPRHPRLQAARAAAEESRSRLQAGMTQLAAAYRERVENAVRTLDAMKAERARLAEEAGKTGVDTARLHELQAEAERLRAAYLESLARAGEPQAGKTARIAAAATAEGAVASGPQPSAVAGTGALAGLSLALGWLYLAGRREDAGREEEAASPDAADGEAFAAEADWQAAEDEPPCDEPFYDEPLHAFDFPVAANDVPLAERLRAVLRRSAEMDGREAERAFAATEPSPREEEIEELRRRMAELRERVAAYHARNGGAQRRSA